MAKTKNTEIRKSILIYSPIYFPDIGGPAVQVKFLVDLLIENRFSVVVLKYSQAFSSGSKETIISLDWHPYPNLLLRFYRWFVGPMLSIYYLLKFRPNIVLINSVFWNGMVMGLICKFLKIPTILKFTGDWVFESTKSGKNSTVNLNDIYTINIMTKFLKLIEKILISNFTIVWVISKFRYKNVQSLTKKPKIWLQSNFHDLPKFDVHIKSRFQSPLIFITTARLIPHKRIDVILRVFSTLPEGSKLIIIGEGSEMTSLKELAKELHIINKVFFLGKISNDLLYYLLSHASAYISWSAEEGAPNSFIESLNFGLPIISASVGGIPEMFSIGSNAAKLIDPENPIDLENFLRLVILSPNVLKIMSISALKEAEKFTKEKNEANFIQLFSSLISNSKF
jgi:glycosyltransferase involved in cell wall biosynthesis